MKKIILLLGGLFFLGCSSTSDVGLTAPQGFQETIHYYATPTKTSWKIRSPYSEEINLGLKYTKLKIKVTDLGGGEFLFELEAEHP